MTLQLAQLFELSRERDIRERLGKLPDTLDRAYDEIYSQIQDQKGSSYDIANRAFQWIMYSRDSLSPDELVAAACQDPETEDVDNIDIDIDTVLGACCNLLVVDQQLKICKFSHLSVQEYFENHHWGYAKSNALIAKVCLTLLNHPIYQLQHIDDIDEGFSSDASCLLTYARFHWATHVQEYGESDIDSHLVSRLKKFLGSLNESSPAYQNWYSSIENLFARNRSFYYVGTPLHRIYEELSPSSRSIISISAFGFHAVISDWWTVASVYVEQTNCKGTTPLQLASIGGFIAVIQELTGREADVNAQGGSFGSALYEASYRGHEMVVRLLLEKGADVNAKGGKYGSALQAASDDGHEMVVRLLLDKGADVNAKGGKYGSALQAASYRGHEMVVRLLLEKGANINAMGGRYGSALQTASYHGHEVVVRLLLEKGADVKAKGWEYGSALRAASYRGHEMVVRLLLEKGANINAMGGRYGSALQTASYHGHEKVVRLLLEKGANINAKEGMYGSALRAASDGGHEMVVRLLLDKGADVNAKGGEYGSALQAASDGGHEAVMRLLLDKGADANAKGGEYGSALQAASEGGHETAMRLL